MKHFIKLLPKSKQEIFSKMNNLDLHEKLIWEFHSRDKIDFEKYFTFSFVRHPLDRLVSAYLDKKTENSNFSNFLESAVAVFDEYQKCMKTGSEKCKEINVHIRPFYMRCPFCDIEFDFVGRLETFQKDVE